MLGYPARIERLFFDDAVPTVVADLAGDGTGTGRSDDADYGEMKWVGCNPTDWATARHHQGPICTSPIDGVDAGHENKWRASSKTIRGRTRSSLAS